MQRHDIEPGAGHLRFYRPGKRLVRLFEQIRLTFAGDVDLCLILSRGFCPLNIGREGCLKHRLKDPKGVNILCADLYPATGRAHARRKIRLIP